jgi:hypothetical protein
LTKDIAGDWENLLERLRPKLPFNGAEMLTEPMYSGGPKIDLIFQNVEQIDEKLFDNIIYEAFLFQPLGARVAWFIVVAESTKMGRLSPRFLVAMQRVWEDFYVGKPYSNFLQCFLDYDLFHFVADWLNATYAEGYYSLDQICTFARIEMYYEKRMLS